MNITAFFKKKQIELASKKEAHDRSLIKLHERVKARFLNNPTTTKTDEDRLNRLSGPELSTVEFKRVNNGVEKELTKNPVKIPGIGLSDEFH